MLLLILILFGLSGILFSTVSKNRSAVILLISAITIAVFSISSLIFCFCIALINYLISRNVIGKKGVFIGGILFNVFGLAVFHYYELFYAEWGIVPVLFGVSYLALQFIDYICKIYFKQAKSPENFIKYVSAVLYAPKFFMGPIVSLPEIEDEISIHKETKANIYYGLNRILLGLFKKLVLAESLVVYVSSVLDFKDAYPGLTVLTGTCFYALQLYFDFSGYCDIAIGSSVIWNINLPENFNFPFRQKTWAAFWKSWHSTLTNWLWQYIFMPLYLYFGRKKLNKWITQGISIAAVFVAMAFFNGIKSGFFISALLYALFYLIELLFKRKAGIISNLFIFLLFALGLLFFRNSDYSNYSLLTERLTDLNNFFPADWLRQYFAPLASGGTLQDYFNFVFTLLLCFCFLSFERKICAVFYKNNIDYRVWFITSLLLITWGVFTSGSRFIYMQF